MQPVYERGKIAAWIAPPRNGINGQPFDYDYVHLPERRRGPAMTEDCSTRASTCSTGRSRPATATGSR